MSLAVQAEKKGGKIKIDEMKKGRGGLRALIKEAEEEKERGHFDFHCRNVLFALE